MPPKKGKKEEEEFKGDKLKKEELSSKQPSTPATLAQHGAAQGGDTLLPPPPTVRPSTSSRRRQSAPFSAQPPQHGPILQPSQATLDAVHADLAQIQTVTAAQRPIVAQFVETVHGAVNALQALARLMQHEFNLQTALEEFFTEQAGDSSSEEEGPEEIEELEEDMMPINGRGGYDKPVPPQGKKPRHLYNDENPDVDRSPARRGVEEPERHSIRLNLNGESRELKWKNKVMDWNDPAQIEALNRWRQQVFRRYLGPIRKAVTSYHRLENEHIVKIYESAKKSGRAINWRTEETDFNDKFAGRILEPGTPPRPERTKSSLMTQARRIPEAMTIVGNKTRPTKKGGTKSGQETKDTDTSGTQKHLRTPSDTDKTGRKKVKGEDEEDETGEESEAEDEAGDAP